MLLGISVFSMMVAVTAYTTAVFVERKAGTIKKGHLYVFVIGLFFDTLGTTCMSLMSESFKFDIHGMTGLIALVLMIVHVVFAVAVYYKGSQKQKDGFHRYSLMIWFIWMIPFVTGMILNMT